ncbi:MAG: hypothetical protein EAZ61_05080 [Oscillatoriales cyanobacterium]|nr:MAG: hypothetical protein EAZ61_05080 [Oscillatoriales cyanobacterium]
MQAGVSLGPSAIPNGVYIFQLNPKQGTRKTASPSVLVSLAAKTLAAKKHRTKSSAFSNHALCMRHEKLIDFDYNALVIKLKKINI